MPQINRTLSTGIACIFLCVTADAGDVMDRHEALSGIDRTVVASQLVAIKRLAGSGALNLAHIRKIIADPSLDAFERESVLYEMLNTVRQQTATPGNREIAQFLTTYQNEINVWHEEGRHEVPLFAIRAAAQGTLNYWASSETRDALLTQFAAGNFAGLAVFLQPATAQSRPIKSGAIAALQTSDYPVLSGARDWMQQQSDLSEFSKPLSVIALRTRDADLYRQVLIGGSGPSAVRLLRTVNGTLSTDEAFAVLDATMQRDDLASAALFEMGRLVDRHPGARNKIISRLADPVMGGTAAAIIAKSGDPALLKEASAYMAAGGLTARRAVLALKLNNSGYARSLAKESAVTLADAQLKKEVNSWLAQ
jgi:hypothetical protein